MKINFSFSKLLDNNRFVKIFSVFVAIIAWFVVATTIVPNAEKVVQGIPVNFDLTGTTPETYGLSLIEGGIQTVDIKVEGKRYKIGNLTADDFIAVPSLTSVTGQGEFAVAVDVKKVDLQDEDYTITTVYSPTVKVTFDFVQEVSKPVLAVADNIKADEGFVKEAVLANPDSIILKGPQTELDKIDKVVVENNSSEVVSDTVVLEGNLAFYGVANNKLNLKNVTYKQQKFEITVSIYKHRAVPLSVAFINIPPGIDPVKLNLIYSDEIIEVSGPQATVDEIKEISLGEIDFRKINVDSVFEFEVTLPPGVVNVNNINIVTVSVDSALDKKQVSITQNISLKNVPATYQVTVETVKINNVLLVGNQDDIAAVSSNDIVAWIDLQNGELTEGKSRVPVSIYCTGNKYVWAVGEYTAVITATKK